MSDDSTQDAVRAFAFWTTHVAKLLDCSYEEAAVFLAKLGPMITLLQDADFQDKLARFAKASAATLPTKAVTAREGKAIH